MADQYSTQVVGFDELIAELRSLPAKMQERIMKGAVGTGANIIKRAAVANAALMAETGTLAQAIYTARMVSQCTPTEEVWIVSVRAGKKFQSVGKKAVNKDAFYAPWVEFGHYARVSKAMDKSARKAGRALGVAKWVPAHPFMRPAFEATREQAVQAMHQYVYDRVPLITATFKHLKAA
jgi:HK97 gp10 family phage protein